jgi:hypothetical protein
MHIFVDKFVVLRPLSRREGGPMAVSPVRVQVLLPPAEAVRLDQYCRERGYKKSTLIARLIREHLERERFPEQGSLFNPMLSKARDRT